MSVFTAIPNASMKSLIVDGLHEALAANRQSNARSELCDTVNRYMRMRGF